MLSSPRRLKTNFFALQYSRKRAIIAACLVLSFAASGWVTYRYWPPATSDAPPSTISVYDILNADDFVDAAIVSLSSRDASALDEVFERALSVAREAGLDDAELAYLQSEQASEYVLFRAKRESYWRTVEQYYRELLPLAPLQQMYPEAQDLFAKADELERSRAKMLLDIASALASPEAPSQVHHEEAKRLWRERHQSTASQSGMSVN